MRLVHSLATAAIAAALASAAAAKLPAPSDEAKAKAAEAAAKTAWGDKRAAYQLCLSQDKAAANFQARAKQAGKEVKPAVATPPCADPGPYVAATPASGAPAAAAAAAPAAPAASAAKKT